MGKLIRCFIVLAIWIVLVVGICAALPDEVWRTFPQKLVPVRTFLAENKIISSEYANPAYRGAKLEKNPMNSGINSQLKLNGEISVRSDVEEDFTKATPRPMDPMGNPSKDPLPAPGGFDPIAMENNNLKNVPPIPELQMPKMQALPNLNAENRNDTLPNLKFDSAPTSGSPKMAGQSPSTSLSSPEYRASENGLPAPSVAGLTLPNSGPNRAGLDGTPGNAPIRPITSSSQGMNNAVSNSPAEIAPGNSSPTNPVTGSGSVSLTPLLPPSGSSQGTLPAPDTASLATNPLATNPPVVAPNAATPNTPLAAGTMNPDRNLTENSTAPRPIGVTVPAQNGIAPASGLMPAETVVPNAASVRNPLYVEQERKAQIQNSVPPAAGKTLSDQLQEMLNESAPINGNSSDREIQKIFMKLSNFLTGKETQLQQEEVQRLQKELDRLAFQVFYNPQRHILEPVYTTVPGETISSVAEKYRITPDFLSVLNQINLNPTQPLPAGSRLKVIHGPVSAVASINKKELLLLFNGLYAGRFRMGCSMNAKAVRGMLIVTNKVKNPDYKGPTEESLAIQDIPGGAANNPLGVCWIELSNGLGLQGTNRPEYIGNETARNGGLIFSNQDISHLNILLPKGAIIQLQN